MIVRIVCGSEVALPGLNFNVLFEQFVNSFVYQDSFIFTI